MKPRAKFWLAAIIAVIGVVVAVRAMNRPRSEPPPEHQHLQGVTDANPLLREAESWSFTTPSADNFEQLMERASDALKGSVETLPSEHRLSAEQEEDLAEVFEERFRLLLDPDFDELETFIDHRGGETYASDPEKADDYRRATEARASNFKMVPFVADAVDVKQRFIFGQAAELNVAPVKTSWNPSAFDIAEDAVEGGLTVYEIRIRAKWPMFRLDTSGNITGLDGEPSPAVVSFAFAWHAEQRQWVPWRTWIYGDTDHLDPPFP